MYLQTEQKYTEVKHQISEIELEFSKAIAEQELNSNHLDTALRSIRILNDAKPKAILTVTEEKLDWCGEQQLCIPLVINNTTNFEIKVTLDSIDFFSEAKRGSSDKLELEWNHNPLRTFEISANSTQKHVMRPTLSVLKSMTLYYTIEYSAKPLETTRSLLLKTAKLLKIDIPKGQFEYKASYSASIRLK